VAWSLFADREGKFLLGVLAMILNSHLEELITSNQAFMIRRRRQLFAEVVYRNLIAWRRLEIGES